MIYLFYAHQLVFNRIRPKWPDSIRNITDSLSPEIYNGGFILVTQSKDAGWYRCDLTPVLDDDVPKELKAWALLVD